MLADTQQKRTLLLKKRIQEAKEGKAKLEEARLKSRQALVQLLSKNQIPEVIEKLILDGWQRVLLLIYLREGDKSAAWKIKLGLAKELIRACSFSTNGEASDDLLGNLSCLLKLIRSDLEEVGYIEAENQQLFDELAEIHQHILKGVSAVIEPTEEIDTTEKTPVLSFDSHSPVLTNNESINEHQQDEKSLVSDEPALGSFFDSSLVDSGALEEDDQFMILVENLKAGSWFKVKHQEKSSRCKLAAVISSIGKYIFVDHTGKKVAEFTQLELALAFRRQEIKQLDDGILFDRALKSIVSNYHRM